MDYCHQTYGFFLTNNTDAVIDAGTDKVIFLHHAAGKNTGFDLFAFSIADSKTYSWMFVLIAHRKAPFIVGVAAGTVKHPQATFDYLCRMIMSWWGLQMLQVMPRKLAKQ